MVNFITRVKSFIDPLGTARELIPATQKGVGGYSNFPMFGYGGGLDSRNRDFTHTEYGAAQASQFLVDVMAALVVWEQYLDGITWHIKDNSTGTTLLSSDKRVLEPDERGARFLLALQAYRQRYKHSYWKSIVDSDFIAGETYIRRVRNRANIPAELQWLNPLATEPFTQNGKIDYYSYYNDDSSEVGYRIPVQDMAYRMPRRNMFDDLRGLSAIMSIIDESNLSRNVKRAFRQYFRNGMILGGIISPDGETMWNPREQARVEEQLVRSHRGVDNAHGWVISPRKVLAETFNQKDVSKDLSVLSDLRNSIMMAIGVPEELAGNPTNATYENLEATQYGWYRFKGIPYAKDVATFHNNQIIPFLEKGVYLEPELSQFEIERPEVVSQDVTASVISLYDAQIKRGQTDADEQLKDIYIVNNRPMHKDVIIKLANTMPSEEVEQLANAQSSLANVNYPSGGDDELSPVDTAVQYDENGTAIPQTEVFGYHIESGIVDVNEARAQLGLPPLEKEDASDTDLVQLNSQLQTVITAIQAGMSIEEAYESVGLPAPKEESPAPPDAAPDELKQKSVKVYRHKDALSELKTWQRFSRSKPIHIFKPEYLLGDVADTIHTAIADGADNETAIATGFALVRAWQKTLQSTLLDFEGDFEELLDRARDDSNNFGRQQWSSAVRSIIRRYSTRAYEDGLRDGGVQDGVLSDEDEIELQDHIRSQSQYVTRLGKTLFTDDGKIVSDEMAKQKPTMWFNKSVNPAYQLGVASADKNGMYEWVLGQAEHCTDCLRLSGQRHRMRDYKRKGILPQSDILECGGFNCKCRLVKVNAKARGRF